MKTYTLPVIGLMTLGASAFAAAAPSPLFSSLSLPFPVFSLISCPLSLWGKQICFVLRTWS